MVVVEEEEENHYFNYSSSVLKINKVIVVLKLKKSVFG